MENTGKATMSVNETAEYIGVGRGKLYNMVKEGKIPYLKFGKAIRIPKISLEAWLNQQCKQVEQN